MVRESEVFPPHHGLEWVSRWCDHGAALMITVPYNSFLCIGAGGGGGLVRIANGSLLMSHG